VFATLDGRVKFEHERRAKKRVRIVPDGTAEQEGAKA
jgi:ribosomal protein L27